MTQRQKPDSPDKCLDLDTLEAVLAKATPGPWREDDCNIFCGPLADARHEAIKAKMLGKPFDARHMKFDAFVASTEQRHPESDADAELICALRNAAPQLLTIARAVKALGDARKRVTESLKSTEARDAELAAEVVIWTIADDLAKGT